MFHFPLKQLWTLYIYLSSKRIWIKSSPSLPINILGSLYKSLLEAHMAIKLWVYDMVYLSHWTIKCWSKVIIVPVFVILRFLGEFRVVKIWS